MTLKHILVAVGVVGVIALSGCTAGGTTDAEGGATSLTIAKPDGAIATESNNPWVTEASAVKLGYASTIFEPLAFVNLVDPSADVEPWLASEITWSDDYTSVDLRARDGVLWNDGEEFTAEDIQFTFDLLSSHPELDASGLDLTDVTRDGDTVRLTFGSSMFVKQDKVLNKFIVPQHIWEGVEDPATFDNPEPVGTGPYVLSQFDTQSVEMTARDDYWGGDLAVSTLYYVSYSDNTALTTALANGDADWAQAFIPNVQSAYLDKDPEHNVYWAAASLGIDAMYVNTQQKPFDDVAFRQAMNLVIDRAQHADIAREGGVPPLTSVTGLPTPVGDPFVSPEFEGKSFEVDLEGARSVLEDAGYTWTDDTLIDPDGEPVSFELSVPQGWNDYVTGISLIADAATTLGVKTTLDTPDPDTWWEKRSRGEFQAILHWTDTGSTPYDLYSAMMDGRWLAPIGEDADFNFGRFDSPAATAALNRYATTSDDADRQAALEEIERIFVDEVPAMPIGTRPFIGSYNTRNFVGWPDADDPYAAADPTAPAAVLVLTRLKAVE